MPRFENNGEWLALIVDQIDAEHLLYADTIEQIPFNDLSKIAVVS